MNKDRVMNEEEFEEILDIDENILDDQSREQPRLVWKHGRILAEAMKDLDYAEANKKLVTAEVIKKIRKRPKRYGMESATEAGIKTALPGTKEYQEAAEAVIEAQYIVNKIQAATNALDHRRTSLSNFVKLNEQNYFSKPRQTKEVDRKKSPRRKALRNKR